MAEEGEGGASSQPLLGVVLCCTSIPPETRSELASRAEQMGAVHKLDLTSDVTHLIVGDVDTPKYRYVAKERPDVKVLGPSWVSAVRQLWIEGEHIDVAALEADHRLATLAGLRICLTGFDDLCERQNLQALITSHGAEYHGDLTKAVTHLLAHKTTGDKYKYARLWKLKTVAIEWLSDSLERGMVLDEESYDPLLPVEDRGRNAWVRTKVVEPTLGKRARDESQTSQPAAEPEFAGRRKLRRTASNKLGSQNSAIWTDIVGGGFAPAPNEQSAWASTENEPATGASGRPLSASAGQTTHTISVPIKPGGKENRHPGLELAIAGYTDTPTKHGIFHGLYFYLFGFDRKKTTILTDHLVAHDAQVASSLERLTSMSSANASTSFMVVPHDKPLDVLKRGTSPTGAYTLVTEWWIERCLHRKRLVDPEQDVTSTPFASFPIPGFQGLTICSTAFSGVDLLHVSKLVKLMGASYDEYLSPNASVLVCNTTTPNKDKLSHASDWKVTAVSADWLWESLRAGTKQAYDCHLVAHDQERPQAASEQRPESETQTRPESQASDAITVTIAALLARKQSNNSLREQPGASDAHTRRKPPSRLLGRAASNASGRSASLSRASSVDPASTTVDPTMAPDSQGPEPSQKVMYDDPEMQEQRERVLRKMGGKVEANVGPARARSIGVAKDLGSIGTRTRQRTHKV